VRKVKDCGLWLRVQGVGFMVAGLVIGVQGLGFMV
jgi:hypothetical protein